MPNTTAATTLAPVDDIMATGNSVIRFAAQMADSGAEVVGAVVLGKTVANKYDKE